jgi:hypothetical protein
VSAEVGDWRPLFSLSLSEVASKYELFFGVVLILFDCLGGSFAGARRFGAAAAAAPDERVDLPGIGVRMFRAMGVGRNRSGQEEGEVL